MWKSASSVAGRRIDSSGGEKSGSFRHQIKNGRSGLIGQPEQDSIRQLWETAMDGVESSDWEDINEELSGTSRTSISSNTSSSSGSSSPIARHGGKLLQVVRRKINLSSGTRMESQRDHVLVRDPKDSRRNGNRTTQDGEIASDKLLEELETLRRKLKKKEKEMQELKNEVSTLRITTAIRSVQPQSQSQAEAANRQEETRRRDSFDSDSSQLSCLDFSLATSTGDLKFEGQIKTKITLDSNPRAESGDQQDSILPDKAAVDAPLSLIQQLSPVNEAFAPERVQSTAKGSASSQVQEPDIADKLIEATKKSLGECKAEISELDYATRFCLVPEKAVKEELYISTQSYVYKTKDEFFDDNANDSRSPPKSTSSAEEEDAFEFPMMFSDSNNSLVVQKTTSSKVTDFDSAERSSCNRFDVEDDEKSYRKKITDSEGVDENALTDPLSKQTTRNTLAAQENPLKCRMKSSLMLEVDKLSKTMTSLRQEGSLTSSKHPDLITRSTSVVSPRRRREQSLTTANHSDVISRSTSVVSPPRSRSVAAQAYPNRGVHVSRQPLDWEVKAGDSVEQPETEEPSSNRNEKDLASKILSRWTSEGSMEPVARSDGLDLDNLPLPKSHRRSCYGLTRPQSREYARRTADRHEGSLAISPSTSPRGRRIPPSCYSARPQLLREESMWKPKSGSLEEIDLEEEVRQILEQSRMLLMSDESGNEHEGNLPGAGSRDKPFSVLALSRQRRSMEKTRTSSRHSPEINQQQERPLQQEEKAIVLYGDVDAWNAQSREVNIFPEVDAEQENEDHSLSRPPKLRNAVEAPYKKDDLQLVWELEVQNSKNQIMSSPSRRSRFFFEANHAETPEVV